MIVLSNHSIYKLQYVFFYLLYTHRNRQAEQRIYHLCKQETGNEFYYSNCNSKKKCTYIIYLNLEKKILICNTNKEHIINLNGEEEKKEQTAGQLEFKTCLLQGEFESSRILNPPRADWNSNFSYDKLKFQFALEFNQYKLEFKFFLGQI